MKSTLMWQIGVVALVLGAAGAWAGSVTLAPVGPAPFRWLDIGNYAYSTSFCGKYDYSQADVSLTYSDRDSSFNGVLSGSGLKPNFAYQLKFEGKPATLGGTPAEDWTNEQLGYAGRWWMDTFDLSDGSYAGGSNSTDTEYKRLKSLGFVENGLGYVFKGYLIFDYVVTTPYGKIPGSNGWGFVTDSSFHVLWKTTQRTPGTNDSTPTAHTISFKSPYYDAVRRDRTVSLYGEWEPERPLPQQLLLPLGTYQAKLVLTEESFHAGPWSGALATDVSFVISAPPPPPGDISGTVGTTAGKAIANATVAAYQGQVLIASARTNTKGKYTILDLDPGDYQVQASATGYQTQERTVKVASGVTTTGVDFRLPK
jgi:hypothetical protein